MNDKGLPLHGSHGSTHPSSVANPEVEQMASGLDALVGNLERVVGGKRAALDLAVTVLLAGGHLLLQDVPGVGKTILARALARSIGGSGKRAPHVPGPFSASLSVSAG